MTSDERDSAPEVPRSEVPDTVERPAVKLDDHDDADRAADEPSSAEAADAADAADEDDDESSDVGDEDEGGDEDEDGDETPRRRDHPTFESLTGFYLGLVLILVVPGGGSALLTAVLGYDKAGPLFPYLALVLLIPLGLLVPERTRRFARYMLLGALLTAVVVLGVGALTLWILISVKS